MWLNRLLLEKIFMEEHLNSHQSNHQELWNSILTMLNLSLLSFAVDANNAQGLSHQCKETQDLRKTVMQRNKSNCHCLRDSTSSMWRKLTTFLICSPKRTVLLRGTRDWWVVQASFIIINSIGLAPFPRLSDPPHSSHTTLLFYLYFWSNKCILGEHTMFLLKNILKIFFFLRVVYAF